jgi:hypothetical protein
LFLTNTPGFYIASSQKQYFAALTNTPGFDIAIPIKKFDKKLSKAQIKSFFSHKPK